MALFILVLVMWFAPKIATVIDVLAAAGASPRRSAAPGGSCQASSKPCSSILLSPIMWFGHTVFLTGLLFGRAIGWSGQARDDHAVPFALRAAQAVAAHAARLRRASSSWR